MSTVFRTSRAHRRRLHWPPGPVSALAGLLFLLTIGAIQGGWAMVANPLSPLGMTTSYLENTPVDDYFWPGMFLIGIAGASLVTIAGLIGWRWRWAARIENAIGYRWPWVGALSIGVILLAFEIIELFLVPFHPVMHPLLIGGSVAIIGLVLLPTARSFLRARS